jgi:hypothetical protein
MIEKHLLVPARLRKPPGGGFSWVDRRFLRDHSAGLSRDAILLYFFFAAVSDKLGISFYGDTAIAGRLRLDEGAVASARDELVRRDLVAYGSPLTQVLSLPEPRVQRAAGDAESLGSILRRLGGDRREGP